MHMCMTNTHMHTHAPIYICMLPDLNINLIHHKNKDVTNYEAGDVKMYSIYHLTKDIHLSKDWCKSQGSSGVIHIEQSSTVEVSLQVSTCSILICNQGLVQKVHLWMQYQKTQSQPNPDIIHVYENTWLRTWILVTYFTEKTWRLM